MTLSIVLENPYHNCNLGSIARNMYCFGVERLYIPKNCEYKPTEKAACGTGNKIQVVMCESILHSLKQREHRKIGFVTKQNNKYDRIVIPINKFRFKDDDLLIFGNERDGLSKDTIAQCDWLVTIPMVGHMACLNVAQCVGIALYEATRGKKHA